MELVYLLAFCMAGLASASKGVSYYYPPVYGTFDEVDYADANSPEQSKSPADSAVRSYYSRKPSYSPRQRPVYPKSRAESPRTASPHTNPRQEPTYTATKERVYYKQPTLQEKTYYKQPERAERTYYKKQPVTEARAYYKPPQKEERSYYKEPEKEDKSYYKRPEEDETSYYKQPETEETYYKEPEEKSYSKKTQKCFQCEYSPPKPITYEVLVREPYKIQVPKTVHECEWEKTIEYVYQQPKRGSSRMYGQYKEVPKYEKICFPKTVFETRTKYRRRYVKKQKIGNSGGFEACKGPLDAYTAKKSGVDDWDCHNNCYVKKDKEGTVTRGCYSGQYKVNPDLIGCHYQGDTKQDLYCFCKGDHCNGRSVPSSHTY